MKGIQLKKYREMIVSSFDIVENLVVKTSYPTVIMDSDYQIIFVNNLALRLYNTSFDETYMKNYFGLYCKNDIEYNEFNAFYDDIKLHKKPVYVDNSENNSYIMVFPIVSPDTNEVIYFHNVFIIEEFHMTTKQIEDLMFNLDFARFAHQISILLENKSEYIANHTSNVSMYSTLLGMEIGINGIMLNKLKLSAGLHDIGKINIPNSILDKEGELTEYEFDQIKLHSLYSGEILKVLKKFNEVTTASLYHHERYDGNGYPNGLVGKEIPLFARIISIADAFDAMTTDRPYRKSMSLEDALEELVKNKYTQFDPFLVDKFVNIDLESIVKSKSDFDNQYSDKYTIPADKFEIMANNLKISFSKIDPFIILENLVNYNLYGLIISKDLKDTHTESDNRFDIMFQNELVDDLCSSKYITGDWEVCLKEKRFAKCNYCPADACLNSKSPHLKKSKLVDDKGNVKYLNTLLYPVYDSEYNDTYIIEFLRDVSIHAHYSNVTASEFFDFIDNISKIFSRQNRIFSIFYVEMRNLCNWISKEIGISDHKIELLNKALSICDLGIIALIDSNEYSFDSIKKLRTSDKHVEIIYNMINNLESFTAISDIVLYHHTHYNSKNGKLSGNGIPIQSYIISVSDLLLTHTVMGNSISETLEHVISMSGSAFPPQICDVIASNECKMELKSRLEKVAYMCKN